MVRRAARSRLRGAPTGQEDSAKASLPSDVSRCVSVRAAALEERLDGPNDVTGIHLCRIGPVPPVTMSRSPSRARSVSAPRRPSMRSLPGPPSSVSTPPFPTRRSGPCRRRAGRVRGRQKADHGGHHRQRASRRRLDPRGDRLHRTLRAHWSDHRPATRRSASFPPRPRYESGP